MSNICHMNITLSLAIGQIIRDEIVISFPKLLSSFSPSGPTQKAEASGSRHDQHLSWRWQGQEVRGAYARRSRRLSRSLRWSRSPRSLPISSAQHVASAVDARRRLPANGIGQDREVRTREKGAGKAKLGQRRTLATAGTIPFPRGYLQYRQRRRQRRQCRG